TFGTATQILALTASVTSTGPGDFNGDGKLDLAVTSQPNNTLFVMLGNGDGTYAAPMTYVIGPGPGQFVVYDVNQDGRMDLVGGGGGSGDVWVMYNLCGSANAADVTLTMSATPNVTAGQNGIITFTITNHSTTTTATDLVLSAVTPQSFFIPQPGDAPFCGQFGVAVSCFPADLAPGASTSFTMTFTMLGAGTKTHTGTLTT